MQTGLRLIQFADNASSAEDAERLIAMAYGKFDMAFNMRPLQRSVG